MTSPIVPRRVFVTGTDTDIGKTLVAAWIAQHWRATYWKPVQSGTADGTDAATIQALAPKAAVIPPRWTLTTPASPHLAARLDGVEIRLHDFTLPDTQGDLVVEGAGGLLVPLNDRDTMADLIARLGLPVVVVARSGLGTINHTLLTLAELRRRALPVLGVILNGPEDRENQAAIAHFGQIPILAALPRLAEVTARTVANLPPPSFATSP